MRVQRVLRDRQDLWAEGRGEEMVNKGSHGELISDGQAEGKAKIGLGTCCCLHPSGVHPVSLSLYRQLWSTRSWRLGMTRSEVVGWCRVMSCTCRGPWGHTEVQGIHDTAQLLTCWGWLAGNVLDSDRRWHDVRVRAISTWKDLEINGFTHRADLMLCYSSSDHTGWHLWVMPQHRKHTNRNENRTLGGKGRDVMLFRVLLRKWFTENGGRQELLSLGDQA